jgi:hypothetical protein
MLCMAFVPNIDVSLGAWLLPALTLTVVTLTLLTWFSAVVAVTAVAVGWFAGVTVLRSTDTMGAADGLFAQSLYATLLLLAAGVFAVRFGLLSPKGTRP